MYYFVKSSSGMYRLIGYCETIEGQGTLVTSLEDITTNDMVAELVLNKDKMEPTSSPNFEISLDDPRGNPIVELIDGPLMDELRYWYSAKVMNVTTLEGVNNVFFSKQELYSYIMEFVVKQPGDIAVSLNNIANTDEFDKYITRLTAMWRAVALVFRFKSLNPDNLATSLINADLKDLVKQYFDITLTDDELKELKIAVKIYATYTDWSLGDKYKTKKVFLLNTDYVKLSSINNIKSRNANVRLSYLANNESLDSSKSTEDEVYTKIPDYTQISDAYRNIGFIEASMRDKIIASSSESSGEDEDGFLDTVNMDNGFIFPQKEMILPDFMHGAGYYTYNNYKTYKNAALARKVDPKFIEGDANMNDLDILPNEERFYKSLCELYDYAFSQASQTSTFDEDKLNAVLTYFEYYVNYLVAISRSYTGYVSISSPYLAAILGVEMELGTPTGAGEEAGIGRVSVGSLKQGYLAMDTLENLKEFINNAYEAGNKYAYCEAIVKLMRWGRKKPSKLKLSGYPKYFNFAKCIGEKSSGSFAALTLEEKDGKSYKLFGKIDYNIDFADRNYISSKDYVGIFDTSIGYLFAQKFTDADGSDKYLFTAFSNLDIIEVLRNQDNPFYEISLDANENVVVNCDRELRNYTLDDILLSVSESESEVRLYKSEAIKTFGLKHPVDSLDNFATLKVIKSISLEPNIIEYKMDHKFTDEQSLLRNIAEKGVSKQECYIARVADNITDFMLEANDDVIAKGLQADDIQGILNVYNLKYISSYKSLNEQPKQESKPTSDTMNVFDTGNSIANGLMAQLGSMQQSNKAGEVVEKKNPKDYLVQPSELNLAEHITIIIVSSTSIGVQGIASGIGIVGIIYKIGNLRVVTEATAQDISKAINTGKLKGKISLSKILPELKETYGRVEKGDTTNITHKYQSEKDLEYFMNL